MSHCYNNETENDKKAIRDKFGKSHIKQIAFANTRLTQVTRDATRELDCKQSFFVPYSEGASEILACEAREPHTPVSRVRLKTYFLASLPNFPRRIYTRSRPFV